MQDLKVTMVNIAGLSPWLITMYTADRCHVPSYFYIRVIDLCFYENYMETTLQRCHMSVMVYCLFVQQLAIPPLHRRWNGGILDSPLCLSVCLSVCRQLGFQNFFKKLLAQFISYLAFTLMGWFSWPLFIFVFLASFSALWWPNIWLKMGFPPLSLKKLLAQFISFLAFILMGWVSWPLYIFVFLASFSWRIPTCVAHNCKIKIFIGYFLMRWVVIRAGVYCPHLWAQLIQTNIKDNTALPYWTFLREIHRWPVDSPDKGPVMWKMLPYHDVIMMLYYAQLLWLTLWTLITTIWYAPITSNFGWQIITYVTTLVDNVLLLMSRHIS